MSDYLWDKEGTPDPEIEHLERLLQPLAYRGEPPRMSTPPLRRRRTGMWMAIAGASLSLAIVIAVLRPWSPRRVQGVDDARGQWPLTTKDGTRALRVGEWLDTGAERAQLTVPMVGSVVVAPRSRVRIVDGGPTRQQLELERGSLVAQIDAPPRQFSVLTPDAMAIDLGCAFRIDVDDTGRTRLRVTAGSVALADRAGHEVPVPAGGECNAEHSMVGTPYASTASADFRALLLRYDRDPSVLPDLVKTAGPEDALTLRYLASVGNEKTRALIAARIAVVANIDGPTAKGEPTQGGAQQAGGKQAPLGKGQPPAVHPKTKAAHKAQQNPSPLSTIKLDDHGRPMHDSYRDLDRTMR